MTSPGGCAATVTHLRLWEWLGALARQPPLGRPRGAPFRRRASHRCTQGGHAEHGGHRPPLTHCGLRRGLRGDLGRHILLAAFPVILILC